MTQTHNFQISPGWQLVPIEPTDSMIVQGFEAWPDKHFSPSEVWDEYCAMSGCQQAAHRAKLCWAAMLASVPSAPLVAVTDNEQRNQLRDRIAYALSGTYYCDRVWSAWNVGTMSQNDFYPAEEVDEVVDGITDAVIAALATQVLPQATTEVDETGYPLFEGVENLHAEVMASRQATVEPLTDEQVMAHMKEAGFGYITVYGGLVKQFVGDVSKARTLLVSNHTARKVSEPEIAFTDENGIKWPVGYNLDPDGKMSCPSGAYKHWLFGYNCGWKETLAVRSALVTRGEDTCKWRPDLIDAARSVGRAEGREDAFERAAQVAEMTATSIPGRPELFQDPSGHQRALIASNIRALFAATPTASKGIEQAPTAPAQLVGDIEAFLTNYLGSGYAHPIADGVRNIICRYNQTFEVATSKADTGEIPSHLSIAGMARQHFGNPIPPAAYAFASDLIAATLATIKAEPTE